MTWSQPSTPLPAAARRARRQRSQNLPLGILVLRLLDGSLLHWKVDFRPPDGFLTRFFQEYFVRLFVIALLAMATLFVFLLALTYATTTGGEIGMPRNPQPAMLKDSGPAAVQAPLVSDQLPQQTSPQAASTGEIAPLQAREPLAVVLAKPAVPESRSIRLQIPNNRQERTLNCEFRSATDLAAYYGRHFTWEQLFEIVGYDPTGNPHKGFAGRSVDDPPGGLYPAGYGVYAEPIARGLRQFGIAATAHQGQTLEWLKQKLADGHPVMVWAVAYMDVAEVVMWQTTDGATVKAVPFEHTFNVVGYDESGVLVNDPHTATTDYYNWGQFQASWALLGNMALTIDEPLAN